MLSAIIVAGGSSQRMGLDKTFAPLLGRPVIAYSLAAFEAAGSVTEIIVVGRAERLDRLKALVHAEGCRKVSAIIAGGKRRQDSVACGLARVAPEAGFVAVHDAARPLIRPDLIEQILQRARAEGGAASGARVVDTLKRVDGDLVVTGGVSRENLLAVETPQIFSRSLLEKAFRAVSAAGVEVTDEISAVEEIGGRVVLLPNDQPNFKITFPPDLLLAETILRRRGEAEESSSHPPA